MKEYLYEDLFNLEDSHWWHMAKRTTVTLLLNRYFTVNKNKGKILDIGCGTGKNLESLTQFGEVYGIDNSPLAISFCKKRNLKNVTLGSAEKIPFKNEYFDAITMLDVLEHVDEDAVFLEIRRILKPNGIVILTVPAYMKLWSSWDEVLAHKKRYHANTLSRLLKNYKFTILKISYLYSFLLVPVFVIRSIKKVLFRSAYGSDFSINTPVLNNLLSLLATLERSYLIHKAVPFGTSIVCVAKKHNE